MPGEPQPSLPLTDSLRAGWGERPALLVVDMTASLAGPDAAGARPQGVAAARATQPLLAAFRRAQLPVFFSTGGRTYYTAKGARLAPPERGAWPLKHPLREISAAEVDAAFAITPLLQPLPGEPVVVKPAPSAFFGTPLGAWLLQARVDTLVVTGMVTSGCVRATVVDGFSLGLRVLLPQQGVADVNPQRHWANLAEMDEKYADVIDMDAALTRLA